MSMVEEALAAAVPVMPSLAAVVVATAVVAVTAAAAAATEAIAAPILFFAPAKEASPEALALAAAGLFGAALVLTQFGLRHMPSNQGALVSIPVATALLWMLAPFVVDWDAWNAPALMIFAAVGLLFPAVVSLLTFESNRRMGPSATGAFGNLAPLFAVLLAAVLLGEAPRWQQWLGIAAIVVGAVLVSFERRWLDASWPAHTLLLPLMAAAIRGLIQPVTKLGLGFWPNPFAAGLIGYSTSSFVVAAASWKRWPARWSPAGAFWFACVGLCNGAAAVIMYAALARGPVSVVAPLVALYPLVTLILSAALLGQARAGAPQAGGVALMVAGVVLLV
jgi:drug/metabolite transporter (DMT)-like permease